MINKFVQYSIIKGYYFLCMITRYLLPYFHQSHITNRSLSSVTVQSCENYFFQCGPCSFRKYWNDVIGSDHEFAIHNMNEWLLNSCFICIDYTDMFSPHFPMTWRHDKIVRQIRSHATSLHSFITTVWWYNILYQTGYFLFINKKQYLGEVIFQAMKTSAYISLVK